MPRVLSGIQSSGNLHIGNYLGAIKNWVGDQSRFSNYFMIADYHAITTLPNPQTLRSNKRELVGMLLACGIDPAKSVLFVQSDVTEHVELAWILTCLTPMGWLERMTQYKDKAQKYTDQQSIGSGLFLYPVLMAADILLYQADLVPVGEDQRQHVEYTRDLAQRFNSMFGEVFTVPAPLIREAGARIMSLSKPEKKMSKSEEDAAGSVELLDPPDVIRQKITRATTDSKREIIFDESPERAGLYNLLTIYQVLSGKPKDVIESHFEGRGYGELKQELASLVIETIMPIQSKYKQIVSDPAYVNQILSDGSSRAKAIASKTLADVRDKIGIG